MSSRRTFPLQHHFVLAALAVVLGGAAVADDAPASLMTRDPREGVRVSNPSLAQLLRQAIQGADAWPEKPACQQLLTDFHDQRDVPLAGVPAERGRDAREQLLSAETTAVAAQGEAIMERDPADRVRLSDPILRAAVMDAVRGANAWLEKPACRQVLSDFADAAGRSLAEVLQERGLRPRDALRSLLFYDGERHARCRRKRVAAITAPGTPVVLVCPAFTRDADGRAAIVHELLHTLGLGENPPTSYAITHRVLERCR